MKFASDHELCIVELVSEFIARGYRCYLEYEVAINQKNKAVVDILAIKKEECILIEVGFLSQHHLGERIALLKSLMPKAKILHVKQWKNYISAWDFDNARFEWVKKKWAWKYDKKLYESLVTGVGEA